MGVEVISYVAANLDGYIARADESNSASIQESSSQRMRGFAIKRTHRTLYDPG
jgi:hypothetical protein